MGVRTTRTHTETGVHLASVVANESIAPGMARITLAADSLRAFRDDGPDQRAKLLLARPGQGAPVMPEVDGDDPSSWWPAWQAMDPQIRPVMRTYTVRASRPEVGELDVDFVLAGHTGPASSFAACAAPGDQVGFIGAYAEYEPPVDARWQLLVGDETALPAVGAILEQLPPTARAYAIIKAENARSWVGAAPSPARIGPQVTLRFVERTDTLGSALAAAVAAASRPLRGPGYVWLCAEAGVVRRIRRQLLAAQVTDRARIMFMGYWKRGQALDPA